MPLPCQLAKGLAYLAEAANLELITMVVVVAALLPLLEACA